MEVLADQGYQFTFLGEKIEVQLRLKKEDYFAPGSNVDTSGQLIVDAINDRSFPEKLIAALNETSSERDGLDYSRYGWMKGHQMQV